VAIETIREILEWGRQLHEELAQIYRSSSASTDDERTQLLLNYIAEHEQNLADMIARYERDEDGGKIDSWMRDYLDKSPFMSGMHAIMDFGDMNSDNIMQATISAHQKMVQMYRDLAENAKTERLEAMFTNLASMESNELMRMVLSGERWSDM
jgi:rubrerythrin